MNKAILYQDQTNFYLHQTNNKKLQIKQYQMSYIKIGKICEVVFISRQSVLKGCQYLSIFITWFHQRNKNQAKTQFYFSLYQKIFHSRRLFRLIQSVSYLPQIINLSSQIHKKLQSKTLFSLLGTISIALFYLFDNISILLMMCQNPYYRVIRRVSYTILLVGIIWEAISIAIRLRQSFSKQGEVKKSLEELTPVEFLEKLNEIDQSRKMIAYQLIQMMGDLFPTLARTNLPEIVLRTKINKGTVGFFGMISALTSIIIKMKKKKLIVQ